MSRVIWNKEAVENLRRLAGVGTTQATAAEFMGTTESAIAQAARRHQISFHGHKKLSDLHGPEPIDTVRKRWEQLLPHMKAQLRAEITQGEHEL